MDSRSLISSVMIFLDAEKFIEEAIESVFAQTYENWELLLVDDGSSDDSTQVALRCAERYPAKVRYLEHPGHQNRGMSASRNLGIRQARGEYISFLDSDDVWFPHTLEQQLAILSSHPEAGMVYGSSLYWYGWTGSPEDSQRDFRDFVEECGVRPNTLIEPPELLRAFLRRDKGPCVFGSIPAPSTIMVRHNVASSVGGFVEESHRYRGLYDDQFFYVKVGLEVPVLAADRLLCKYRQHPEATTHVEYEAGRHTSARLHWLSWIGDYLFERGIEDVEIWKLLHEEQSRTYGRRVRKLERALAQERRKNRQLRMSNKQLKKSERSSKKEPGRYGAEERNQRSVLRRQYMNGHALNELSDKAWKLLRRVVGYLRTRASSR
jgi:glycosyltransferase involved in cell wall biosynthesis